MVSSGEPAACFGRGAGVSASSGLLPGQPIIQRHESMEPAAFDGMPDDVLIVEDDPLIALDFEDRILGFGVKTVRASGSVAGALALIDRHAPDFALLDVALVREKSFAIAERLEALKIPFAFITGYGSDVALPPAFSTTPLLPKPCASDALKAALRQRSRRG